MDAHILAVDDNPEIREIIEILLTGEGFAVDQAGDGTQALAMLKEKHYDLIIDYSGYYDARHEWISDLSGDP